MYGISTAYLCVNCALHPIPPDFFSLPIRDIWTDEVFELMVLSEVSRTVCNLRARRVDVYHPPKVYHLLWLTCKPYELYCSTCNTVQQFPEHIKLGHAKGGNTGR